MSETKNTLNVVLQKLVANRVNVNLQLTQAQGTIVQADEEAVAAAKVLIAKFGNPQGAGQILANVYQLDALADVSKEMDTMIAGIQSVLSDDSAIEAVTLQLAANTGAANSPLSGSGAVGSADTVADAGQSSEAASPAA